MHLYICIYIYTAFLPFRYQLLTLCCVIKYYISINTKWLSLQIKERPFYLFTLTTSVDWDSHPVSPNFCSNNWDNTKRFDMLRYRSISTHWMRTQMGSEFIPRILVTWCGVLLMRFRKKWRKWMRKTVNISLLSNRLLHVMLSHFDIICVPEREWTISGNLGKIPNSSLVLPGPSVNDSESVATEGIWKLVMMNMSSLCIISKPRVDKRYWRHGEGILSTINLDK